MDVTGIPSTVNCINSLQYTWCAECFFVFFRSVYDVDLRVLVLLCPFLQIATTDYGFLMRTQIHIAATYFALVRISLLPCNPCGASFGLSSAGFRYDNVYAPSCS